MIKYVILAWRKNDLSDAHVMTDMHDGAAKVFGDSLTANIHAKSRSKGHNTRVVEIPICDNDDTGFDMHNVKKYADKER